MEGGKFGWKNYGSLRAFPCFFFFGWQFLIGFAEIRGVFLLGTNIFSPKV